MKGYLERLASSVLRQGGSIRPVLTPIFSAPHYEPPALPIEEEIIALPTPLPVPELRQEHRTLEPASPPLASTTIPAQAPHRIAIAPAPAQAIRVLPPGIGKEFPRLDPLVEVPSRSKAESGLQPPLAISGFFTPPHHQERPPTRDRTEESASPVAAAELKTQFTPLIKPVLTPPAIQPLRDSLPRPKTPAPEPDEIHIHIGRIEVMASAPAPARPAPTKAARKPLTLDEYLKQRHGRA
jgi:hypothetical protein